MGITTGIGSSVVVGSGQYAGNNAASRAIAHGLGKAPYMVVIWGNADSGEFALYALADPTKQFHSNSLGSPVVNTVTAADATSFYVLSPNGCNDTGETYNWSAFTK